MFSKRRKVLQYDLNVNRPESERAALLYPGDSINLANLRVFIHAEDKEKFRQLVKDTKLQLAIWSDDSTVRTVVYPPYPSLKDRFLSLFR